MKHVEVNQMRKVVPLTVSVVVILLLTSCSIRSGAGSSKLIYQLPKRQTLTLNDYWLMVKGIEDILSHIHSDSSVFIMLIDSLQSENSHAKMPLTGTFKNQYFLFRKKSQYIDARVDSFYTTFRQSLDSSSRSAESKDQIAIRRGPLSIGNISVSDADWAESQSLDSATIEINLEYELTEFIKDSSKNDQTGKTDTYRIHGLFRITKQEGLLVVDEAIEKQ